MWRRKRRTSRPILTNIFQWNINSEWRRCQRERERKREREREVGVKRPVEEKGDDVVIVDVVRGWEGKKEEEDLTSGFLFFSFFLFSFLDAFSHLYKRVCLSVRRSVGPSVRCSSVRHTRVEFLRNGLN